MTLKGTKDNINVNTANTKIFINGNTSNYAGAPGSIQHCALASEQEDIFFITGQQKEWE